MKSQARARRSAFTLIELLTVIAIIAVLAAIIFPVFGAVRENARRADCMTNMKTISTALKQYELDNRKYPDFLFAPAIAEAPGGGCLQVGGKLVVATGANRACTQDQASGTGKLGGDYVDAAGKVVASGGLYPEYVKSFTTYSCKNNTWFYVNNDPAYSETPGTDGYPVTAPKTFFNASSLDKNNAASFGDRYGGGNPTDAPGLRFYKFDSYDTNPFIVKDGSGEALAKIDATRWVVRYQRQWLEVINNPSTITDDRARQMYQNQMIWRNPSDDAAVTMCSHHATKGKAIVLYLSGTAKVLDIGVLQDKEAIAVNAGLPAAGADFDTYKMTP